MLVGFSKSPKIKFSVKKKLEKTAGKAASGTNNTNDSYYKCNDLFSRKS